jgi:hypothetical protein
MKKISTNTFFVDKSNFLRYIYTMKKLTKTEMQELQAQLNQMDYGVKAILNSDTLASPEPSAATSDSACRYSAVYGD